MNPRTHCDVMVLSQEDNTNGHPYWYACVLGVFHAQVLHIGLRATNRSLQRMEFLWVRWFGAEPDYHSGLKVARLPKIGFVPDSDPEAFSFLDPSLVIRGCHLLPAFANGRTSELLKATRTAGRPLDEIDDWTNYYVNMYVTNSISFTVTKTPTDACILIALLTGICSCALLVAALAIALNVGMMTLTTWILW